MLVQGEGVRGGIRASALRAALSTSVGAGLPGYVAVDGDESSPSRDGSPWEEEGGGGGRGTVTILEQGMHHRVASKPPSFICHHSGWAGSRLRAKREEEPEITMLQRVRDSSGWQHVNLVHRLD